MIWLLVVTKSLVDMLLSPDTIISFEVMGKASEFQLSSDGAQHVL